MAREYKDLVQDVSTTAGTVAFVSAGTPPTGCQAFSVHTVGATFDYKAVNGAQWEVGTGTWNGTNIARSPSASSNAGALVNFTTAPTLYEVVNAASAADFARLSDGVSFATYLTANPGSTPSLADIIPLLQGNGIVGVALSAIAKKVNEQWPTTPASTMVINSTAAFPLDSSVHLRKRIFCTATPAAINFPTTYDRVGEGFECEFVNLSGAVIPLGAGIVSLPSGTSIPVGGVVRIFSGGGVIYANLNSSGAAAGAVPGQVTGLTLGAATSTTQPLSWTAVSGATGYKVEYKRNTDSAWIVAFANNAGVSCAVPSLTAATSYDYRASAFNGSGPGTVSTTVTGSTAAAAATQAITVTTPATQTVGTPFNVTGTYVNGTPTALDYRLSDDTAGVWTQPTGTVTISGGTFSFSVTPSTESAGRTISVRDRTTLVAGTSGTYVVNAAAGGGGGTAPFTIEAMSGADNPDWGWPASVRPYVHPYWLQAFTPTGAATAVSANIALSESPSVVPTSAINMNNAAGARGVWFGGLHKLNSTQWLADIDPHGVSVGLPTSITMYPWVFITDSNGVTWKFIYPGIKVGDNETGAKIASRISPQAVA